jgi:WD40 repeat protein
MPRVAVLTVFMLGVSELLAQNPLAVFKNAEEFEPPLTRREYDTPGLVVELNGRNAAIDVLMFTSDGRHVLTAGDDKIVRTWDVTPQGLVPSVKWPVLRWPTFRERRGNIYSAALSPDPQQKYIVVAGDDPRQAGFGAVVLERATAKMRAVTLHQGQDFKDADYAFLGSVWSCAFSPSGKRIALGTEKSSVLVWDFESGRPPRRVLVHDKPAKLLQNNHKLVRFVGFESETVLISITGFGEIRRTDLASGQSTVIHQLQDPIDTPITRSGDGHTIAWAPQQIRATNSVMVSAFPAIAPRSVPLPKEFLDGSRGHYSIPYRVALSKDGRRIAVGTRETDLNNKADFYRQLGGGVYSADLDDNPRFSSGPRCALQPDGLAFHPASADLLAISGGDNFELTLHDLKKNAAVGEAAVAKDARSLWNCVISPDAAGRFIAFQSAREPEAQHPNRRGRGPWTVFDCDSLDIVEQSGFDAENANLQRVNDDHSGQRSGGWRVLTALNGVRSQSQWHLQAPQSQKTFKLEWNTDLDEFPRCYTFIPATATRTFPQLLVGHYWGFSIFDCIEPKEGDSIPRARLFRGHEGYVTGIAVSADGRRVVTCSRDMTLCGWSLGAWSETDPQLHPQMGAEFIARGGKLFAGRIAAGSPAWEMGLQTNDEIQLVVHDTNPTGLDPTKPGSRVVYVNMPEHANLTTGTPADVATARYPTSWRTIFGWKTAAGRARQATTLTERPLWRMLPQGRDWVLWRWRDYQYASVSRGDAAIGWQRNYRLGELKAPEFYKAEQFRSAFKNPAAIKQTLHDWQDSNVSLEKFARFEPPQITIAARSDVPASGSVPVRVSLAARGPTENQAPARVLVWVNDYLFKDIPANELSTLNQEINIPVTAFRKGTNILIAQVYSKAGVRGQSPSLRLANGPAVARPKLHALFFGVGDYSPARANKYKQPEDLQANADAAFLATRWSKQAGKAFADVEPVVVPDQEVTPERIRTELDRLARDARPDDLVILGISGHGENSKKLQDLSRKLHPNQQFSGMRDYAFLTGAFRFDRVAETTMSMETIQERFEKVNARKIVFLDACHSGTAVIRPTDAAASQFSIFCQHEVGCAVFAACKTNEKAIEEPSKNLDKLYNRLSGLFSIAISRVLVGAEARIGDGSKKPEISVSDFETELVEVMKDLLAEANLSQAENRAKPPAGKSAKDYPNLVQTPDIFIPETMKSLIMVRP